MLKDRELISAAGISEAIERFNKVESPRSPEEFWVHVYKKLNANNAYYFLNNLVKAESAERYDAQNALKYFPMKWRSNVSIKKLSPGNSRPSHDDLQLIMQKVLPATGILLLFNPYRFDIYKFTDAVIRQLPSIP